MADAQKDSSPAFNCYNTNEDNPNNPDDVLKGSEIRALIGDLNRLGLPGQKAVMEVDNGDGQITRTEFTRIIEVSLECTPLDSYDALKHVKLYPGSAYVCYDGDLDGDIEDDATSKELTHLQTDLAKFLGSEDAEAYITSVDINSDHKLDFGEFKALVEALPIKAGFVQTLATEVATKVLAKGSCLTTWQDMKEAKDSPSKAFDCYNTDKADQVLKGDELDALITDLTNLGLPAEKAVEAGDTDNNKGEITPGEFAKIISVSLECTPLIDFQAVQNAKLFPGSAYVCYDGDLDGDIEGDELTKLRGDLVAMLKDPAVADRYIREADKNGNGNLDYDEFKVMVQALPASAPP